MEILLIFGGSCVGFLVLCLITREMTEQRLRNLRVELMTLRSQLRVLEERVDSYQTVRSQVREILQRIESRKLSAHDSIENIYDRLRQLYQILREEDMPEPAHVESAREAETVEA